MKASSLLKRFLGHEAEPDPAPKQPAPVLVHPSAPTTTYPRRVYITTIGMYGTARKRIDEGENAGKVMVELDHKYRGKPHYAANPDDLGNID